MTDSKRLVNHHQQHESVTILPAIRDRQDGIFLELVVFKMASKSKETIFRAGSGDQACLIGIDSLGQACWPSFARGAESTGQAMFTFECFWAKWSARMYLLVGPNQDLKRKLELWVMLNKCLTVCGHETA